MGGLESQRNLERVTDGEMTCKVPLEVTALRTTVRAVAFAPSDTVKSLEGLRRGETESELCLSWSTGPKEKGGKRQGGGKEAIALMPGERTEATKDGPRGRS